MRSILLFLSVLCSTVLMAQGSLYSSLNYQGVARDANGDPIPSQSIGLQFEISAGPGIVYRETQTVTTNAQGLFTTAIGSGTPNGYPPLDQYSWYHPSNDMGILIYADFTGGTNYQFLGIETIRAVPSAHTARQATTLLDSSVVVDRVQQEIEVALNYRVGIGTDSPSELLEVNGNTKVGSLFVGDGVFSDPSGSRDMIMRLNPLQDIYFSLQSNGANEWEFRGNTAGDLRVYAGFDERLTLQQDGDLGLGTTSPATTLDVTGNVRIADAGNVNGTDPSAALEVASTTGAILFPRLNTGQRNALTGTPGMVVYNTEAKKFQGFVAETVDSVSAQYNGPLGAYAIQLGGRPNGNLIAGGQSFQLSTTGTLKSITVYDLNYQNLDVPGDNSPRMVHVKVLNGLPNDPTATVLASTMLNVVPSNSGARVITFPQAPILQAATDYSFVIEPDASSWDGTWWESSPSGTVPLQNAALYPNGGVYGSAYPNQGSPSYGLLGGSSVADFRFQVELQVGTEVWIDLH